MRSNLAVVFAVLTTVAAARAGEPFYVPHGLDAPAIIKKEIAEYAKPGFLLEDLAGAQVAEAHALLFRASVDDRPHVVDMCVIGSEINVRGRTEWLLMTYFRWPYGPRVGHAEWAVGSVSGVHSPLTIRRLAARPTNKDIKEYLDWSRWEGRLGDGFKDVHYLCFAKAWQSFSGSDPLKLEGAVSWPPSG